MDVDTATTTLEQRRRDLRGLTAKALDGTLKASEKREIDRQVVAAERQVSEAERSLAIAEARQSMPGSGRNFAVARGALQGEFTYRPDQLRDVSFLRDVYTADRGDPEARERLWRNGQEAADYHSQLAGVDRRDMGDVGNAGGQFVPPLYLADLWVGPSISRRPLADSLPSLPLPPTGTAISIPQLASGIAVAARSSGGGVTESDGVTATINHDVNEISGMVDIDRIAVMRSDPTLDIVVGQTLRRRHDAYLEQQLVSGSGTPPEHTGLLNAGGNTVTYTSGSPTAAGLLSAIANCISQIGTNREGEVLPDLVVLHPRRAAWAAVQLSSTVPLFQVGTLNQAAGQTQAGFVDNLLGLKVVTSTGIPTALGSGTNEDRVLVLASEDFILLEGPIYARTFEQVGSATGAIRFDLFSHSAFLSKRYPKSVSAISGTALAAPTFG